MYIRDPVSNRVSRSLRTKRQPPPASGIEPLTWAAVIGALQFVGERQPAHAAGPGSISLVTRVKPSASISGVNRAPGLDELAGWVEPQHIAVKNPGRRDRRRAVRYGRARRRWLGTLAGNQRGDDMPPAAARSVRPPAAIDSGRRSTDVRMAQLMRQNARTLAPV